MKTFILCAATAVLGLALSANAQTTVVRPASDGYKPRPTIFNPQNPFEQIGKLHNDGLSEIGNSVQWVRTNLTPEQIYEKSGKFLESKQVVNDFATIYRQNVGSVRQAITERSTDQVQLLQRVGMSSLGARYVKQALDLLRNSDVKSVEGLADQFKSIETEVMNNASLSKDDRDVLLASLAVGRYSIDYWSTMISSQPQNFGLPANPSPTELYAKAKSVAEEDVKGGLRGGYVGGITGGVVGGPAGILGGIAGGVATGAIFASASAYFFN